MAPIFHARASATSWFFFCGMIETRPSRESFRASRSRTPWCSRMTISLLPAAQITALPAQTKENSATTSRSGACCQSRVGNRAASAAAAMRRVIHARSVLPARAPSVGGTAPLLSQRRAGDQCRRSGHATEPAGEQPGTGCACYVRARASLRSPARRDRPLPGRRRYRGHASSEVAASCRR